MSGPPVSTRFVKGRSGNPSGRPRNSRGGVSAFDVVIERTLHVHQDGAERELTVEEALQWRTYQDALAGDRPARREVLRMIAKREKVLAPKPREPKLVGLYDWWDPDNADAVLVILGIAALDPAGDPEERDLLLEPWVVTAAIARARNLKLDAMRVGFIRRQTQDGERLRGLEANI